MTQPGNLQELLLEKYQRQKRLNEKLQELEDLKIDLSADQFGRFFGNTYLVTKRMITLIAGIVITALALLLLIQPDLIITDSLMNEMVEEESLERMKLADEQIEMVWKAVYNDDQLYRDEFKAQVEPILNFEIEEDFQFGIHFIGYILLILGLIVLYISRLTRKMWTRNGRIGQAQLVTKDLIEEFKRYMQEDEKELNTLQEMAGPSGQQA